MKKILLAIVAYLIMILIKTVIHKYGFNNIGNNRVLIVTYLLSLSLTIIFFVILNKLFFPRS